MRGISRASATQPPKTAARLTRREMLATLAAIVAAIRAPRAATAGPEPVRLHDVRLIDGPFLDAQRRDSAYLLSLQPDRMLHNFRANAGLEPKAPVYMDGKLLTTLKGDRIVQEFLVILEDYVARTYPSA